MNRNIQFFGREWELEFIESQTKKISSFTVIYGRRRVGKSELLKKFIKGKKAIYMLATQEVEKEIMESFSADIAEYFDDAALKTNPFSNFRQIMEYLKSKDTKNLVVIIDEFPYLVDANPAIPSIMQKYWDTHFSSAGIHIILCGSSIGAMETEVLGRKSPLYGRRTGQWKVEPMGFGDFMKFFEGTEFKRLVELYSISGGIPLYINELSGKKSALENAKYSIASRGSLLYQETEIILKEELREPKTYFSIIKEIARGKNTSSEISNSIGAERTAITRYLSTLEDLELIETIKPINADKKSRRTIYTLKDNYFKFWFRFVLPHIKELDSFILDGFERDFKKNFNTYVGMQFENVCREATIIENPVNSPDVGRWWGTVRDEKTGERKIEEIDIVSLNEDTSEILFSECKWKENVNAGKILSELKKKAMLVEWRNDSRKEHYTIFAKSFSGRIEDENVILFDLADIERIFRKRNGL